MGLFLPAKAASHCESWEDFRKIRKETWRPLEFGVGEPPLALGRMMQTDKHSPLKSHRERLGLTLEELAALADTDPSTLSRLERGLARTTLEWIDRIAQATNSSRVEIVVYDTLNEEQRRLYDLVTGVDDETARWFTDPEARRQHCQRLVRAVLANNELLEEKRSVDELAEIIALMASTIPSSEELGLQDEQVERNAQAVLRFAPRPHTSRR